MTQDKPLYQEYIQVHVRNIKQISMKDNNKSNHTLSILVPAESGTNMVFLIFNFNKGKLQESWDNDYMNEQYFKDLLFKFDNESDKLITSLETSFSHQDYPKIWSLLEHVNFIHIVFWTKLVNITKVSIDEGTVNPINLKWLLTIW